MNMIEDKIRGMFYGIFLGDALGMPVETWTAERIAETYGRVTKFLVPDGHKWFAGQPAGCPTDDWQLSKAVSEALILSNGLNMDTQANFHIQAFQDSTNGWGRSTRESVRRLINGSHWQNSGQPMGVGNGVAMKIAPLGAYAAANPDQFNACRDFACNLALMTHKSSLGVLSGLIHMRGIFYCLTRDEFPVDEFINAVALDEVSVNIEEDNKEPFTYSDGSVKPTHEDFLSPRMTMLRYHKKYNIAKIIDEFGGGSCYVRNSLPFTYMFFLKNPHSIESLYDIVSSGGDTDTNGSMVGALLGSLNGMSVFPKDLIGQIPAKSHKEIIDLSDRFFNKFS
jgi:ADP-ribosylglycohydrolase